MPRTLAHTPAWLAKPSPGFEFFQSTKQSKAAQQSTTGAPKRIAVRQCVDHGPEVFAVVGNELRWADLGLLKDAKRGAGGAQTNKNERQGQAYRVLQTPVSLPIQQLSISENGTFLAILTSHTAHVCILPSSSHLHSQDTSPLRLKSFQLGPSAHVLEKSPLVSAHWHPLSPEANCLVTVTADACVRLWELDTSNRYTFNEPALAIDLKKLANASTSLADFSASKYGTSRGFSPDEVEMEVAASCFGGHAGMDEHGWASMTLWVAMTEGDVYALCPFLPSKFKSYATMLPSLSTSVVAKTRALSAEAGASENERRISEQQTKWLADIDAQDPIVQQNEDGLEIEIYERPQLPGAIPKIQGPFNVAPDPDFGEITDIYVIAPDLDVEALFGDDENAWEGTQGGLSVGLVCLATSSGKVNVCLDLDGTEAEWLPSKKARGLTFDEPEERQLLLFETVDLAEETSGKSCRPTFSRSATGRYELFVTSPSGVHGISFTPWIHQLEEELSSATDSGVGVRIDVLLDSKDTSVDHPIKLDIRTQPNVVAQPNTAVSYFDPSWGHLLITLTPTNVPHMAVLDVPSQAHPYQPDEHQPLALPGPELRAPYQPSQSFDPHTSSFNLQAEMKKYAQSANYDLHKPMQQFTPADLKLLTETHRLLSRQTYDVGLAAAELFRACERMRNELRQQVEQLRDIARRVDSITGEDEDDEEDFDAEDFDNENANTEEFRRSTTASFRTSVTTGPGPNMVGKDAIDGRIGAAQIRNESINQRADELRQKMLRFGGMQLSSKEIAFRNEVERLQKDTAGFDDDGDTHEITSDPAAPSSPAALLKLPNSPTALRESREENDAGTDGQVGELTRRYQDALHLQQQLADRVQELARTVPDRQSSEQSETASLQGSRLGVSTGFRNRKMAEVWAMLERETALVEAVSERLKALTTGA